MDATTVYNKSLRAWRKDTAWKDVWIPTIEFFNEFDNLKDILKKADVEQQIEKNEMNKTVFDIWNIWEVSVDAWLDQKMKEPLSPIWKCVTKKIYNSSMEKANAIHWTTKPDKIIIHWTESREAHNESNKTTINKFLSHYYISQEWIIYQYVLGNEWSSGPIELWEKIVSINHAWIDKDPVYGAIRDWDWNLTYKSIWIEVETVEKWQPSEDQIKILKLLVTQLSSHYNIPIKNILTHADVAATKKYWRWRKSDLSWFDTWRITWISNWKLIDWDVAKWEVCPNMTAVVKEYIGRGISVSTIKKILEGRNVAIKILRNKVKNWEIKNYHNSIDPWARRTLEELQKLWILK